MKATVKKPYIKTLIYFNYSRHKDLSIYKVIFILALRLQKGSLTLAMGKCLWFSVKIKVCQSSLSSP